MIIIKAWSKAICETKTKFTKKLQSWCQQEIVAPYNGDIDKWINQIATLNDNTLIFNNYQQYKGFIISFVYRLQPDI